MQKTYRYRLYPNKSQERALNSMMYHSKRLYNLARIHREFEYKSSGHSVSWQDQSKLFVTTGRKVDSGFALLPYDTAGYLIQRLDKAFEKFFKKQGGYPKRMRFCETLEFKYPSGIKLHTLKVDNKKLVQEVDNEPKWTRLYVMNVGDIRVRVHRDLPEVAKISYASITKNPQSGYWHVQFTVDDFRLGKHSETPQYQQGMNCVGIDIGLVHAFTLSDDSLENPFIEPEQHYQSKLRDLRILQRKLDRQRRANNPDCYDEKGRCIKRPMNKSNQMKRSQEQIKRLHFQVSEKRKEWLHAFTKWLVDSYDLIAIEDLSPQFMIKNGRLALKALDISFNIFKTMLEYKCRHTGTILVKVPPQYTSQTCIRCGNVDAANRKSQSQFECTACGYQNNADVIGSKNILTRALNSYS